MNFHYIGILLLCYGHQQVAATPVAIFAEISLIKRVQM